MTPSEIQRQAVLRRWREEETRFPLPTIDPDKRLFPYNYPCDRYEGYYYIPFIDSRIVINKRGEMIKLLTGHPHKFTKNAKGYHITSVRIGQKYRSYRIHRIVAMLFCEIPERHKDIPLDELEVNHKDGNKSNNDFDNLEWVNTRENMKHAWKSGFIKTEIPILSRSLQTGEVVRHQSLSECAQVHVLTASALSAHVNSIYAGKIISDGFVFKLDDGSDWPEQKAWDSNEIRVGMNCDILGTHVDTNKKVLFNSLNTACRLIGLDRIALHNHRRRKGADIPYNGWLFTTLTGEPMSKKFKGMSDVALR